ncbi:unnamed protein product [Caenorhabditis brenneri]
MSDIECGICILKYDEKERTPRMLSNCGHTVCQQCALKLSRDERTITCPFDRKVTQLNRNEGASGLPKNFALLDLSRKANQEQEKKSEIKTHVPCYEDPLHEAVVYCQQCEVDYCDNCFTSAHKPKALSAHQKINSSERPIKLPKCPKHPHNIAEFFCTEAYCKNPTKIMCQTCALFDQHKSHKYDFLMDKLHKNEQTLKEVKQDLKVFRKSSEALIDVANLSLGSYEVTGEAFKNVAKSISDQFDLKKKEALRELTQFANEKKKDQTVLKRKIDEKCREVEKVNELIEKKLKMKNDLQNTDEITNWKKRVGSGEPPSSSDFHNLNEHEFIVSDMKLQIKPKWKVPEPSTSVQSVSGPFEAPFIMSIQ